LAAAVLTEYNKAIRRQ